MFSLVWLVNFHMLDLYLKIPFLFLWEIIFLPTGIVLYYLRMVGILLCFTWSDLLDFAVSDYVLEEEAREYVNSVHIDDDTVDKYSLPEQSQEDDTEAEVVVEEAPAEETLALPHSVNTVQEPSAMPVEEPVEEPPKRTYASIVSTSMFLSMQPFCLHVSICFCETLFEVFSLIACLLVIESAIVFSLLVHIHFIHAATKTSSEFYPGMWHAHLALHY